MVLMRPCPIEYRTHPPWDANNENVALAQFAETPEKNDQDGDATPGTRDLFSRFIHGSTKRKFCRAQPGHEWNTLSGHTRV